MAMAYCFSHHAEAPQKAIALSKPTISKY